MISFEWIRIFLSVLFAMSIGIAWYRDRVRNEGEKEQSEIRLYRRKWTWSKQICCVFLVIVNSYDLLRELNEKSLLISLTSVLVLNIGVILSIYFDSLPSTSFSLPWCVVYGTLMLYEVYMYILKPEYLGFAAFLVSILPLVITVLGKAPFTVQQYPPTAEYTSTIWEYFTFTYLNESLIHPGLKKGSLTMDEVPKFCDKDMSDITCQQINRILNTPTPKAFSTRKELQLAWYLFLLIKEEWFKVACFQWLSSTCIFLSPLALEKLMIYVKYQGNEAYLAEGFLKNVNVWVVVGILFLATTLQGIGDGQHYSHGR
jgi:hypothetical protein